MDEFIPAGVTESQLIVEELEKNVGIETILLQTDQCVTETDDYGFEFSIYEPEDNEPFTISVGYQAGPLCGSGGSWEVNFDENDHKIDISQTIEWRS